MAAILNSAILVSDTAILDSLSNWDTLLCFSQIHSKTLFLNSDPHTWLIQSDYLNNGTHLELCHLEIHHLRLHSDFDPKILWLKLVQSDSKPSFILTQLDDGSHLEFCHVGFRHCHLGFKNLVIFSQIHSKTLFLHSDPDSNSFNLINLMMATIFNSSILNSAILDSAILHKTLTQTSSIWLKLFHSD